MTAAARKSAYPVAVEDLIPRARRLATQLGAVPSRNRLMAEYRIGAGKARTILAALAAPAEVEDPATETTAGSGTDASAPAGRDAFPRSGAGAPGLRAVPDSGEEAPVQEPAGPPDSASSGPPAAGRGLRPGPDPAGSALGLDAMPSAQATPGMNPGTPGAGQRVQQMPRWPLLLLAAPAFVAVWSGWVGLGSLAGFGMVHPLPGIADRFSINSAITLPVGVETYAAYALRAWLSGPGQARGFAKWSAIGSLGLGAAGQVAYHLLSASGVPAAPWPITTVVACLPVAVLGMGAALAHLIHSTTDTGTTRVAGEA